MKFKRVFLIVCDSMGIGHAKVFIMMKTQIQSDIFVKKKVD